MYNRTKHVIGESYVFLWDDIPATESYLSTLHRNRAFEAEKKSVSIPDIALARAKRAAMEENADECRRILLQNGSGIYVDLITAGILEKADYLCLVLMDHALEGDTEQKYAWLCFGGTAVSLEEEVINFRNCTRFISCSGQEIEETIRYISEAFLL